jgi:hypothetical protein
MIALWVALLSPSFRFTETGHYQRSASSLWLLVSLSSLLAIAALANQEQPRCDHESPAPSDPSVGPASAGLGTSSAILAFFNLLLICYHLAVPVALPIGGYRTGFMAASCGAALSSLACFRYGVRGSMVALADLGTLLATLAVVAAGCALLPAPEVSLAEFYPPIFAAAIAGGSIGAWGWSLLHARGLKPEFDLVGFSWKTALAKHSRQGAFLASVFSLMMSFVLAVWPRWPSIAVTDDSLERVSWGLAANLTLILFTHGNARRLGGASFQWIAVLSLVTTITFLAVRLAPFASRIG